MAKTKTIWICNECGSKQMHWTGSCLLCHSWNTMQEKKEEPISPSRFDSLPSSLVEPVSLQHVSTNQFERFTTGWKDIDRVLGGGAVQGSLILIGGEPGIGKSTLLLALADQITAKGKIVLYISAEESNEQIALRAKRMKVTNSNIYLYSEIQFSRILEAVQKIQPDILIIDSIQMLYKETLLSAPGSVCQIKEVAMECMQLSKKRRITTFLVGHVTKTGELAGPRVLEHIVDTVLEFEGDRQQGFRLLRSGKNRFGPTDDIAIFQMQENGLEPVDNPSSLFLEERKIPVSGSAIIPATQGSRALLVEVQALVIPSSFSTASRKSTGFMVNRLALLLAVLEKKIGYQLHTMDIFVSIAGGLKITEPALDLGVIVAMASSFLNRPISLSTAVIGEVGLGGEVRSVRKIDTRIKEAIHMGFVTCIVPKKNFKEIPPDYFKKITIHGVELVEEVVSLLLP